MQSPPPDAHILVVDDSPDNLTLMARVLSSKYEVSVALNGRTALSLAQGDNPPDLILLDVSMPVMDGHEVCRRLKAHPNSSGIPVLFLTASQEEQDQVLGFELGAEDYIYKPVSLPILLARVRTHLTLKEAHSFLSAQTRLLEWKVNKRTRQLDELQDALMVAMGSMAETRDNETGMHIRRTQHYTKLLAERLLRDKTTGPGLHRNDIDLLFKSAALHDIGKVGVPDSILLKPGKLDEQEMTEMRKHTLYGRRTLESAEQTLADSMDFLRFAKEIAYSHHERWDGKGYPEGLSGEEIPLSARIMAVGDVYDALISRRVYKDAIPHPIAMDMILQERGAAFDPQVVDALTAVETDFRDIASRFCDSQGAIGPGHD